MLRSVFQVEIDLAGHPLLVALGEQSGNETQTGCGVGEDRGDACAAFDLAIDAFEAVGGAQAGALAVCPRRLAFWAIHSLSVSGRWKLKISRERGLGS